MGFKRYLLLIFVILAGKGLLAQSNTMYYLRNAPQSYYLNPAHQPQPNFFLGLPVLSSAYFDVRHNSIGLSDFFWNDPETGMVLHPLHSPQTMSDFLDKFEEANIISGSLDFNIVSMGFRVKSMYFTLDLTSKAISSLGFPNELARFGLMGNEDYQEFHFSDMGFHASEHLELGLGVSRKFGDMFTVGIRPKILMGISSISSMNNDVTLSTSHEIWQMDSYYELQMAIPGVNFPVDDQGLLDPTGQMEFDTTAFARSNLVNTLTGNKGFGIDLGVNITPMDELIISASLVDLGAIKWNNYTYSAQLESSFEFSGIELNSSEMEDPLALPGNNSADSTGFGAEIIDSLMANFNVSGGTEPFTTRLAPKLFVGASYSVFKSLSFGMLARFDFPETGFDYDLMLHANWHPSTYFALSLNYSPFEGGASTFGLGASYRGGPLSFYAVADYNTLRFTLYKYQTENRNIPVALSAENRTAFNFRLGVNFVLGWNQRKKQMKDKPMYLSKDY